MQTTLGRTIHVALIAAALGTSMQAMSAVAYDESVQGDLSNIGTEPTFITFGPGDNDLLGASGLTTSGITFRDYGSFVVPANAQLTGIQVLPGTIGAEDGMDRQLFIGLQAGSQLTVNPVTYAGQQNLIGWNHFSSDDIGKTLALTGDGVVSPLPLAPGQYSFWIQDYDGGAAPYGLRFTIAAVPEPGSYAMMGLGLAVLGAASVRRRSARR